MSRARRLPQFHATGNCSCQVCAEREQLTCVAADKDADHGVKFTAMSFLGAMEAVESGRMGSFTLEDCFD